MSKTLIWQQVFLQNEGQAKLFAVSHALVRRLNPDCDLLVIDNGSLVDPRAYATPDLWFHYPHSIGHFVHGTQDGTTPRDGPGRGHAAAWSIAMASGYERGVYLEGDTLFAHPVEWGFSQMTKPVACQPGCRRQSDHLKFFIGYETDWHIWWVNDLKWFKTFDFLGQYDWPNRKGEPREESGETLYQNIFGEHLQTLPVRGARGDAIGLTVGNYAEFYPGGCDIITHVSREAYAHFLNQIGHPDLVEKL